MWGSEANNTESILKKLDEFRRLFQFFERLSQDENILLEFRIQFFERLSQDNNIPLEFRNQCQDIVNKLAAKKHPENKLSIDKKELLKSYLIATLIHSDNDQFLLNAWLIIDDSVKDLSKKFKPLLDKNEQQTGTLCKLSEIPRELNKFLEKALSFLRGKKYCLTIEFFLTSDLMCMEIDRWKITDSTDDSMTLGIKYPIRLRSLERLELKYLDSYWSQWCEYWDKVRNILQNQPTQELFETLEAIESFNWKLLRSKLKEKIGLKVTCAHPQSIRKDLFKAILQATTPVAIWTRNDISNVDQVTAINEILTFKPLRNLCESVRQTREQADAETEEHLGLHLALLWENPYRLTPDIMVELMTPGQ